jgi:sugar lactone lactonase YvrE
MGIMHERVVRAICSAACLIATGSLAAVVAIDPHAAYPEGPVWRDGKLFYVEYAGPGIKAWDGKDSAVYWRKSGCGASGLIEYRGHWLVACYDSNTLVEIEPVAPDSGTEIRVFKTDGNGQPFIGPNDFAADGAGGVYFSASGIFDLAAPISGALLHLSADGHIRRLADTVHYSNGLTVSKDRRHLLVAEMLAGRILSFPIRPDGSLGPRSVWARLQDLAPPTPGEDAYDGPDGLKLGPDGNYYIAQNGSGRVLVVSDDKKLIRTIELPHRYVTNMNFGADAATVFITVAIDPWKAPYPGAVYRWTK